MSLPRWDRGPLDLAIQLRGYDNFVGDTMDRPEFVHALMRFLIEERIRWWDAYLADTGATDKAAIDAMSPQSGPAYNAQVEDYNNLAAQYNALAAETKTAIDTYDAQVTAFNACLAE